jgi:hypothetical protein
VTKTCGDFNTLLSTQEADSQTCFSAKDAIFDACCFAGSDQLLATSKTNAISISSDSVASNTIDPNACQLCPDGDVGIDADISFNGNPTTCVKVYTFLREGFSKVSESCTSAQSQLAELCCRHPSELKPGEYAAFGQTATEGSEPASVPSGKTITPPTDFSSLNAWTIKSGSRARLSNAISSVSIAIVGVVTLLASFL